MRPFLSFCLLLLPNLLFAQEISWYQESWAGGRDLEVSSDGLVTIAGTYNHESSTVNGVTLNTSGIGTDTFDAFVARYTSDGDLIWVQTSEIDGYGFQHLYDVATDSEDAAIITGHFGDDLLFSGTPLVPDGFRDIFVAKYDRTGHCVWSKKMGGPGSDFAYLVKTDAQNNIYVSGNYDDLITIDGQTITGAQSMSNQAIIKLDPNGNLVWVHTIHATSLQKFDVTDDGIVIIAGSSQNHLQIDGVYHTITPGEGNQYVVKLNQNGTTDWVRYFDSPNFQSVRDIIFDENENGYLHFSSYDDITIDNDVYPVLNQSEKVLKLNPDGSFAWLSEFLGVDSQCSASVPRMSLTADGLPCLACGETELVDSTNYQNHIRYGMTHAIFDPNTGQITKEEMYNLNYGGKVSFDQHGSMYSFGYALDGVQFNGAPIPEPTEGSYFYKIEGPTKSFGQELTLFPNPSSGVFNIQLESESPVSYVIKLYDPNGKLVKSSNTESDGFLIHQVDTTSWAQGVYLGVINTADKVLRFRFVKQQK